MNGIFIIMASIVSLAVAQQSPVLIIPGTGGNRLEARLDKSEVPHFYCSKKADWYDLWLDVKQLLPGAIDCWCENIKLLYDAETSTFSNNKGVETRVPCYGDVCGIEYLDPSLKIGDSAYFHDIIQAFADKGYVRGENIVSAPYDFRYSAHSNKDDYVNATMTLAEDLYEKTGQKVLWVSHSMGGLWSHYILSKADQAWKDKYIEAWVPVAPAYGGTANEMKLFASGNNEGIPGVSGKTVREEQRSYESNFWLLPSLYLWDENEVLVTTPSRSYTSKDFADFFVDIGFPDGKQIYEAMKNEVYGLEDPGLPTFVRYGVGQETPASYEYTKAGDWDNGLKQTNEDGDGTVNRRSLEAGLAMKWENADHKAFDGEDHTSVLKNKDLIAELLELANA
ncbi:hypothetical protein TrCOL_g1274 [Triparma columacea]|uniref:Lecithin:cholesterol acyltransferase n=1 Tax=Triparma columacea TaxID=722753 RepID=A0A9W7L5W3_9STRA|nr:hypothetical protein TrCOL_g1274 [Triparma columacea]